MHEFATLLALCVVALLLDPGLTFASLAQKSRIATLLRPLVWPRILQVLAIWLSQRHAVSDLERLIMQVSLLPRFLGG